MSGGGIVKIVMMVLALFAVVQPMEVCAQSVDMLSEDQRSAIRLAQARAEEEAAPIALRLGSVVKQIYTNNLADAPNAALTSTLDAEMKELVWQLLLVKGESMWAAVRALTPQQKAVIREQVTQAATGSDVPDLLDLIARRFNLTEKK